MPNNKTTQSMKAIQSIGPSIKSIGDALGNRKKKRKPEDTENEVPMFDRAMHGIKRYFNPRAKDVNLPKAR